MRTIPIRKTLILLLSALQFVHPVMASLGESNLWAERRKGVEKRQSDAHPLQLASLPSSLGSQSLYSQLPAVNTALPLVPKWEQTNKNQLVHFSSSVQTLINSIPLRAASIQDVYVAAQSVQPPVVLVQDIHLNAEAQTNIASVLQQLIDQKKIGLVGVEGAFDVIELASLRAFDQQRTKKVATDFIQQKLLAAPSYVGVTSPSEPPVFQGVDDETAYEENVQAYRSTLPIKEKVKQHLSKQNLLLSEMKAHVFSKDMKHFDDLRTSYHKGHIGLGAYIQQLGTYSDQGDFTLSQFREAYNMETSLDFRRVEEERKNVLEKLTQHLSKSELSMLLSQSLAYRMGQVGFGVYYQNLKNLCESKGVSLQAAPAFDNYIRYVLLSDGINATKLFRSVERLEQSIVDRLVTTEEEKKLAEQSELQALQEKLVEFSLTAQEWEKYQAICRGGTSGRPNSETRNLDAPMSRPYNLSSFERFYEEADIRSQKMVQNLLAQVQMTNDKVQNPNKSNLNFELKNFGFPKPMVLVVGGFHTPQIADLLKAKNISYVIVSPKVTKVDENGSAYLSAFAREKTPLDKLFSGEKLFLALKDQNFGDQACRVRFENAVMGRTLSQRIFHSLQMTFHISSWRKVISQIKTVFSLRESKWTWSSFFDRSLIPAFIDLHNPNASAQIKELRAQGMDLIMQGTWAGFLVGGILFFFQMMMGQQLGMPQSMILVQGLFWFMVSVLTGHYTPHIVHNFLYPDARLELPKEHEHSTELEHDVPLAGVEKSLGESGQDALVDQTMALLGGVDAVHKIMSGFSSSYIHGHVLLSDSEPNLFSIADNTLHAEFANLYSILGLEGEIGKQAALKSLLAVKALDVQNPKRFVISRSKVVPSAADEPVVRAMIEIATTMNFNWVASEVPREKFERFLRPHLTDAISMAQPGTSLSDARLTALSQYFSVVEVANAHASKAWEIDLSPLGIKLKERINLWLKENATQYQAFLLKSGNNSRETQFLVHQFQKNNVAVTLRRSVTADTLRAGQAQGPLKTWEKATRSKITAGINCLYENGSPVPTGVNDVLVFLGISIGADILEAMIHEIVETTIIAPWFLSHNQEARTVSSFSYTELVKQQPEGLGLSDLLTVIYVLRRSAQYGLSKDEHQKQLLLSQELITQALQDHTYYFEWLSDLQSGKKKRGLLMSDKFFKNHAKWAHLVPKSKLQKQIQNFLSTTALATLDQVKIGKNDYQIIELWAHLHKVVQGETLNPAQEEDARKTFDVWMARLDREPQLKGFILRSPDELASLAHVSNPNNNSLNTGGLMFWPVTLTNAALRSLGLNYQISPDQHRTHAWWGEGLFALAMGAIIYGSILLSTAHTLAAFDVGTFFLVSLAFFVAGHAIDQLLVLISKKTPRAPPVNFLLSALIALTSVAIYYAVPSSDYWNLIVAAFTFFGVHFVVNYFISRQIEVSRTWFIPLTSMLILWAWGGSYLNTAYPLYGHFAVVLMILAFFPLILSMVLFSYANYRVPVKNRFIRFFGLCFIFMNLLFPPVASGVVRLLHFEPMLVNPELMKQIQKLNSENKQDSENSISMTEVLNQIHEMKVTSLTVDELGDRLDLITQFNWWNSDKKFEISESQFDRLAQFILDPDPVVSRSFSQRFMILKLKMSIRSHLSDVGGNLSDLDGRIKSLNERLQTYQEGHIGDPLFHEFFPRINPQELLTNMMQGNSSKEESVVDHLTKFLGHPDDIENDLARIQKNRTKDVIEIPLENIYSAAYFHSIDPQIMAYIQDSSAAHGVPPEILLDVVSFPWKRSYTLKSGLEIMTRRGVLKKSTAAFLKRSLPESWQSYSWEPDTMAFLGGVVAGGHSTTGISRLRPIWVKRYDGWNRFGVETKNMSSRQIAARLWLPKYNIEALAVLWENLIREGKSARQLAENNQSLPTQQFQRESKVRLFTDKDDDRISYYKLAPSNKVFSDLGASFLSVVYHPFEVELALRHMGLSPSGYRSMRGAFLPHLVQISEYGFFGKPNRPAVISNVNTISDVKKLIVWAQETSPAFIRRAAQLTLEKIAKRQTPEGEVARQYLNSIKPNQGGLMFWPVTLTNFLLRKMNLSYQISPELHRKNAWWGESLFSLAMGAILYGSVLLSTAHALAGFDIGIFFLVSIAFFAAGHAIDQLLVVISNKTPRAPPMNLLLSALIALPSVAFYYVVPSSDYWNLIVAALAFFGVHFVVNKMGWMQNNNLQPVQDDRLEKINLAIQKIDKKYGKGAILIYGGVVRDHLLGKPISVGGDVDILVRLDGNDAEGHRKALALFREFVTEIGITDDDFKKHNNMGGVMLDGVYLDFLGYYQPKTFNLIPKKGLGQFLGRIQLSVNTMFMDSDGQVIDRFGGKKDLRKKVARFVGKNPQQYANHMSILLALRFKHQLGFHFDSETEALVTLFFHGKDSSVESQSWTQWLRDINFAEQYQAALMNKDFHTAATLAEAHALLIHRTWENKDRQYLDSHPGEKYGGLPAHLFDDLQSMDKAIQAEHYEEALTHFNSFMTDQYVFGWPGGTNVRINFARVKEEGRPPSDSFGMGLMTWELLSRAVDPERAAQELRTIGFEPFLAASGLNLDLLARIAKEKKSTEISVGQKSYITRDQGAAYLADLAVGIKQKNVNLLLGPIASLNLNLNMPEENGEAALLEKLQIWVQEPEFQSLLREKIQVKTSAEEAQALAELMIAFMLSKNPPSQTPASAAYIFNDVSSADAMVAQRIMFMAAMMMSPLSNHLIVADAAALENVRKAEKTLRAYGYEGSIQYSMDPFSSFVHDGKLVEGIESSPALINFGLIVAPKSMQLENQSNRFKSFEELIPIGQLPHLESVIKALRQAMTAA